jgi:transcriptional regulator with XRE-family HTH domain
MVSQTRGKRGRSNQVDAHVGSRVRTRRTLMGLSQEKLGDALGLTFQQVQKYERGANRIGASRIYQLSHILDVPISYFFDDMEEPEAGSPQGIAIGLAEGADQFNHDPMAKRETLELVRSYYKITDAKVRKRVFELVKALGKSGRDD